jgi:hypothetical protein
MRGDQPYRRHVPARHQRVLLTLYRAHEDGQPVSIRICASRSGVALKRFWPVFARLRRAGWIERDILRNNYTMPVYGWSLTDAGREGVVQLMGKRRWKRRHRKVSGRCKWNPDRTEGGCNGASAHPAPQVQSL